MKQTEQKFIETVKQILDTSDRSAFERFDNETIAKQIQQSTKILLGKSIDEIMPMKEVNEIKNADHRAGAIWAIEEIKSRLTAK